MKKNLNIKAISLVTIVFALLLASCGKDDPTPVQANTKKLKSGEWKIKKVTVDAVDKTSEFTGFTLKFDATSYSSTNGNPVWPSSDSWIFSDKTATLIKRGDGVEVFIVSVDKSTLIMKLTWEQTIGSGRSASIGGEYIFEFTK